MQVNSFMPEYMVDFKCIGSRCKDTCCAGWDINIDEDSYNRYEESTGELNKLVENKYKKNECKHDFFNEGFMILKEKNKCPFLNDDYLCDIHGKLGEEHLCITCRNYPRVFNIVDDVYEKSGLPSCEEICFESLLNKNKMEFVEVQEDIDEEKIEIRRIIDTGSFEDTSSLLQYFWQIRVLSINILQNRKYLIEERLNILKYFYKEIEKLQSVDKIYEIEELLENINDDVYDFDKFKGETFTEDYNFYCDLKSDEIINNIESYRLKECVEEYIKETKNLNKNSKINYIEKLNDYDYIFENYLVNSVFKDLNPFNKGENLTESLNELINIYKIIKSYIIGIHFNSKKEITERDVVRVIQALSKDIEHNNVYGKIKCMRI